MLGCLGGVGSGASSQITSFGRSQKRQNTIFKGGLCVYVGQNLVLWYLWAIRESQLVAWMRDSAFEDIKYCILNQDHLSVKPGRMLRSSLHTKAYARFTFQSHANPEPLRWQDTRPRNPHFKVNITSPTRQS